MNATAALPAPRNGALYRILVYLRVSKDDQTTGSHTFETQKLRIQEKLDRILGPGRYELTVQSDNGVSGAYGLAPTGIEKRVRQSLQVVREELQSGRYDALAVYALSRLVRSPRWFYVLMEDVILPSGVMFFSATEDIDVSDPQQRMVAGMMAVVDGAFRDSVVKRCKDACLTRAQGGYLVGQPSYGWAFEPRAQVPPGGRTRILRNEEQGQWVVRIADWYRAGWSTLRIAEELNTRGVPSPSGRAPWGISTVLNILNNPVHAGFIRCNDDLIQGEHHERRYYDWAIYEQIQQAKGKRLSWRTNTKTKVVQVLSGVLTCARCGKRLYLSQARGYAAYRCTTGHNQGRRTCPDIRVKCEWVEEAIVREVAAVALQPQMQALLEAEAEQALEREGTRLVEEHSQLKAQVAAYSERFARWADLYTRGEITDGQFAEYNATLKQGRADAEARLAQVAAALQQGEQRSAWAQHVRQALLDFPRVWQQLNLDERREVLSLLLERAAVNRDGKRIDLSLKLPLLEERTVEVVAPHVYRGRAKAAGVEGLTKRQMALLYHLSQGRSMRDAATQMGISLGFARSLRWQVQRHMGMQSLPDILALARSRIHAVLPSLPVADHKGTLAGKPEVEQLNAKLREVLALLTSGGTNKEVAKATGLSVPTVAGRRARILRTFGTNSIFVAAQKARELGLLPG